MKITKDVVTYIDGEGREWCAEPREGESVEEAYHRAREKMRSAKARWASSDHEESWSIGHDDYDTREEAIKYAPAMLEDTGDALPGETGSAFIGCTRPGEPPDVDTRDAEWFIERMSERNYDSEEAGDWNEDWLRGVTKEQAEDLRQLLHTTFRAWLRANGLWPEWYVVDQIECIEVEMPEETPDP